MWNLEGNHLPTNCLKSFHTAENTELEQVKVGGLLIKGFLYHHDHRHFLR